MKARTGRFSRNFAPFFAAAIALAGCTDRWPGSAHAASARPVRIIVGVSAGGGQDLYARVMAPHLARHLPGQPPVIVENMPGAGGLIAASYLARRVASDGLTLGLFSTQAVLAQLLDQSPTFDIRAMPAVGSPAGDGIVCSFSRRSGFTLESWRRGGVPRFGMTNRGSTTASYAQLIATALELPLRPVIGYAGTSDIRAALASGEVDGLCMSRSSFVSLVQAMDDQVPAVGLGVVGADAVPGVTDARSLATSDRARSLLDVAESASQVARYLVLPPQTSSEDVAAVRVAFDRTMDDPAFQQAARAAHLAVDPQSAAEVQSNIRRLLELPAELRRDVIDALNGEVW